MPIYDYKCPKGHEFEAVRIVKRRNSVNCPECGSRSCKIQLSAVATSVFQGGWFEHIAREPIHCSSPQELRDACDEHGKYSKYLQDGIHKTSPGPDHIPEDYSQYRKPEFGWEGGDNGPE